MFCSVSGLPCVDPVFAVPCGYLFERSTIERHVSSHGTCPVSGVALRLQDLLKVQAPENAAVSYRIPANMSIPSLLNSLQSEYDAVMLEIHKVKCENTQLKRELCSALYQHDAACRVIARLIEEGKITKNAHDQLKSRIVEHSKAIGMDFSYGDINGAALSPRQNYTESMPTEHLKGVMDAASETERSHPLHSEQRRSTTTNLQDSSSQGRWNKNKTHGSKNNTPTSNRNAATTETSSGSAVAGLTSGSYREAELSAKNSHEISKNNRPVSPDSAEKNEIGRTGAAKAILEARSPMLENNFASVPSSTKPSNSWNPNPNSPAKVASESEGPTYNQDDQLRHTNQMQTSKLQKRINEIMEQKPQLPQHEQELNEIREKLRLLQNQTSDPKEKNEAERRHGRQENAANYGPQQQAKLLEKFIISPESSFNSLEFRAEFATTVKTLSDSLSCSRRNRRSNLIPKPEEFANMRVMRKADTQYMGLSCVKSLQSSLDNVHYIVAAGKSRGSTLFTYDTLTQVVTWPVKQTKIGFISILSHDPENPLFLLARKDSVALSSLTEVVGSYSLNDLITGLSAHPSGKYFAVLTVSNGLFLFAVDNSECPLYQLRDVPANIRTIAFHPDGLLLAVVSGAQVQIYSIISGDKPAVLDCGAQSTANITHVAFSDNGFHFACANEQGQVFLWDLRKLVINATLKLPSAPSAMAFDYTGAFLAVVHAKEAEQYRAEVSFFHFVSKLWRPVPSPPIECSNIYSMTDIAWGKNSRTVVLSSSLSKSILFLSMDEEEAAEKSF